MTINTLLRVLALSFLFVLHVSACDVLFPAFQSIYDEVPFTVYWNGDCTGPFTLQLWDRDLNVLQYSYTGNDTSVQLGLYNLTGTTIYFYFRDDYGSNLTSSDYIVLPGSSNGTLFSLSVQSVPSKLSSLSEALTSSLTSESPAFSLSFQSVFSTFTSAPSMTNTITSIRRPPSTATIRNSNPTPRNLTNIGGIIGGAVGGAVALASLSALLLHHLRSHERGNQKDINIGGPVAPVPSGRPTRPTGTHMSGVGRNVHNLAYSSPGSMTGHHTTVHTNRDRSRYDNPVVGAAIPERVPQVVNPGIEIVAPRREPRVYHTAQMSGPG
ncbi:uncharacterized protein EI90DRAFT_3127145 [Cantharellus anzutake]|uniref:uncharacterized protein n=1 Tax=Cantharellus anzutake TaxID=1750568 RepID=UPI001902FD8C|nr:uncharacterized protein EI90DRAFT_3127145 [Cantharellus anzutake]KAF8327460.1 hypothetical protein EI90DRAFT_3127145 [Cantharellus anzutake]